MVGVPGRSKGCHTCKQRKIACSLEKPACRTCIKSGRTCAGYQRETIFLLDHRSKGDGPRGYRKPATDASYVRRAAPKKKTEPASPPPGSPSSKSLTRYLQPNSITGTLSPSTHSAYRQQLLNAFLTSARFRLPQSSQRESAHNPIASFLILLPTLSDVSPALETSFLALCTATLGRADSSQALVHESLKFYTQGLWELQRALWDPKSMYTDGTLSSCMLLVAYEVIECPGENITGWVNHMKGCSKLFELRGPKAYNSVFSHMLFSSFRILEIQQAITERRRTFLSSSEWTTLPWKVQEKTKHDELLDVMVLLPNVIAEGYDLYNALGSEAEAKTIDPMAQLTKVLEIINHTWQLDAKFRAFYTEFERENLGQLYWPELSLGTVTTADEAELGKVFPVAFQFLNMRHAYTCVLYWASTAILWAGMGYMYKVIANDFQAQQAVPQPQEEATSSKSEGNTQPGFGVAQLPPLEHRADISSAAKNICQSVEYLILNEDQSPWASRAVFPLKVCIEAFHDTPGCEREEKWSIAAMEKLLGAGVRILGHIPDDQLAAHAFLPG